MRRYDQQMESWKDHAEYHMIPTGHGYKRLLEERCSLGFLDTYNTSFSAKNAVTQYSYVEVCFTTQHIYPNGDSFIHHWYLQNEGYSRPDWVLSTNEFGRGGKGVQLHIPDRHFQAVLQEIFNLPFKSITLEQMKKIVQNATYSLILPNGSLHYITKMYNVKPHIVEVQDAGSVQIILFGQDEIVELLGYLPIGHTSNMKEVVTAYYRLRMDHDDFTWNLKVESAMDSPAIHTLSIEKKIPENLLPTLPTKYNGRFTIKGK